MVTELYMNQHRRYIWLLNVEPTYNLKGTPGGLKSSITPCLKRSRFLTSVPVVPLNLYKNMYRFKGAKCVRVKDSCLFGHVRIVSYRSPVVPLRQSVQQKNLCWDDCTFRRVCQLCQQQVIIHLVTSSLEWEVSFINDPYGMLFGTSKRNRTNKSVQNYHGYSGSFNLDNVQSSKLVWITGLPFMGTSCLWWIPSLRSIHACIMYI